MPSDAPCRYQIVFPVECGRVLSGVLDDATIESRHGYTCVVATVRDQPEFYGLLDMFADLGLRPVSLIDLGADHLVPHIAWHLSPVQAGTTRAG